MLSFVFDDGFETDRTIALDIFRSEGCVASTAIIVDRIGEPGYMDRGQIAELQDSGWEVMSHTLSHPDLSRLDDASLDAELSGSLRALRAMGFEVRDLVYPGNRSDKRVEELAGRYYLAARGGGKRLDDALTPRTRLRSYEIKYDLKAIEALIDQAASEGKWLILYHHRMFEKLQIGERNGKFETDEEVAFSPSGAVGLFEPTLWNRIGNSLYIVPVSGEAAAGDVAVGRTSGARAEVKGIGADDREILRSLIEYDKAAHPGMPIVTVERGALELGMGE
jgi:hypothetical protein